jgi:type I restriction enzyme S subunit
VNGSAFKPTDWESEGLPIVRIQNLNNQAAPFNLTKRRLPEKFKLHGGELLFAWSGTPGTSFGAHIWRGGEAWLNQHIFNVLFDEEEWDKKFLQFAINQNLADYIRAAHGGAGLAHITKGRFEESELPQPPPSEQRQIVAELEKQFTRLEAGVAALRRVQANLKRYRTAILKAACEGRLVPTEAELAKKETRKFESAEALLARILAERRQNWQGRGSFVEPAAPDATKLDKLPDGWTWATVEQISNVVRGASPRPAGDPRYFGGNVPWITVGPLTADNSPFLKSVSASLNDLGREHSRYIEPQTLLLTNSGATLGVPKITLIGGCINDGVAAFLDVGYPLKLYLLYFLRTQTERLRSLNQGAAQPNLNTTIIKSINVPLPPLAEQTRIVADMERRLSVAEGLESVVSANIQRATRLRRSILQKAFTGELTS